MPNLSQIRNLNLKVIFLVHFMFTSLSSLGHWSPSSYLFYNSVLILFLIWSLSSEQSYEPIQMAIFINGCAIILDILLLVMGFPDSGSRAIEKFSAAFTVLHLIIRPFSSVVLIANFKERSGSNDIMSGLISQGRSETYEDIDRAAPTYSAGPNTGYDFTSAQPI